MEGSIANDKMNVAEEKENEEVKDEANVEQVH